MLRKTINDLKKFFRGIFRGNQAIFVTIKYWCQIFRDTENPCHKPARWLMYLKNQSGFVEKLPVCDGHHPNNNPWTRRHYEIKNCEIISTVPLNP